MSALCACGLPPDAANLRVLSGTICRSARPTTPSCLQNAELPGAAWRMNASKRSSARTRHGTSSFTASGGPLHGANAALCLMHACRPPPQRRWRAIVVPAYPAAGALLHIFVLLHRVFCGVERDAAFLALHRACSLPCAWPRRHPIPEDDFDAARSAYEWPRRAGDLLRDAMARATAEHRSFESALKARRHVRLDGCSHCRHCIVSFGCL